MTEGNISTYGEDAAKFTAMVLGWWRKDLPLELSYRYWRDVHGLLISRVPGLYQYRLLHLAASCCDIWTGMDGIETTLPTTDQPQGMMEQLFLSAEDLRAYSSSPLQHKYIYRDENNFCDRNATLSSVDSNAHTYLDRTNEATQNGAPDLPSFGLCIQQANSTNSSEFRHHLVEQVVRPWSEQNQVMRLRLSLLEPYDESANSPGVSHLWPPEKQYQAWIELVVRDQADLGQLFPASTSSHAHFIQAIHTFPIVGRYTLVHNGKPTDAGLRGFPAVQTIEQVGAVNQKATDLLATLYGDVVHGQISQSKPVSE